MTGRGVGSLELVLEGPGLELLEGAGRRGRLEERGGEGRGPAVAPSGCRQLLLGGAGQRGREDRTVVVVLVETERAVHRELLRGGVVVVGVLGVVVGLRNLLLLLLLAGDCRVDRSRSVGLRGWGVVVVVGRVVVRTLLQVLHHLLLRVVERRPLLLRRGRGRGRRRRHDHVVVRPDHRVLVDP